MNDDFGFAFLFGAIIAMGEINAGSKCLCGRALPKRAAPRGPALHCSYWCSLVEDGPAFYTLESIEKHMLKIRGPLPHEWYASSR